MIGKLESLVAKFHELERELSAPEIFQDQERYKKVAKKHAELGGIVPEIEAYKALLREIEENQELSRDPDPEICELAQTTQIGRASCRERV